MNVSNSTQYSELYLVPPHVFKNVLKNVEEDTELELKSLNQRISPNMDFLSKTMRDNRNFKDWVNLGLKRKKHYGNY